MSPWIWVIIVAGSVVLLAFVIRFIVPVIRLIALRIRSIPHSMALVITFLDASDIGKMNILKRYPTLLRPDGGKLLEAYARVFPEKRHLVEEHLILLARCREIGIGQAFAERDALSSSD